MLILIERKLEYNDGYSQQLFNCSLLYLCEEKDDRTCYELIFQLLLQICLISIDSTSDGGYFSNWGEAMIFSTIPVFEDTRLLILAILMRGGKRRLHKSILNFVESVLLKEEEWKINEKKLVSNLFVLVLCFQRLNLTKATVVKIQNVVKNLYADYAVNMHTENPAFILGLVDSFRIGWVLTRDFAEIILTSFMQLVNDDFQDYRRCFILKIFQEILSYG